jgi:hypothetical protein
MTHRQMLHRRAQAFKRAGLLVEADDISRENEKRDRKGEPLLDISKRPADDLLDRIGVAPRL